MPPLDATRYCLDAPPASRRHDLAAWKTSVDNAHSQLEHQYLRIINLELMLKYGDKVREMRIAEDAQVGGIAIARAVRGPDRQWHCPLPPPSLPTHWHRAGQLLDLTLLLPPSLQNWRAQGQLVDSIAKQYEAELSETKRQITAVNLERKLQQTAAGVGEVWKEVPEVWVSWAGGLWRRWRERGRSGGGLNRSIRSASYSGRLRQVAAGCGRRLEFR